MDVPREEWRSSKKHERDAPTEFQQRVYDLIKTIPQGYVSTYGDVAKALRPPSSARAVGNALRNNPYAPVVPCHRVVASSRKLGGFDGQIGDGAPKVEKKRTILESEGVVFTPQGLIAEESIHKW